MRPDLIDFSLIVTFAVIYPAYGAWRFKRRKAQLAAGELWLRRRTHFEAMAWLWAFSVMLFSLWVVRGRPLEALGIRVEWGVGFWIALLITALIVGFFVAQWRAVRTNGETRKLVREALEPVAPILPHTTRELRSFVALSFTAGCSEELLFRGYLIWVGSFFMGVWPAAVLSSLIFGYGHLYQNIGGMIKTAGVGFVAAALYIIGGSIWLPMIMHALVDVVQGRMAFDVIRDSAP